ncbi:hypothetical protein HYALB_00013843 [Hymenoscyphus albidus]|uniref:Uncharacterized protein n=1 Tax=Hymenoscyphus albidus TaxID=595503 RepID=A0A9N9LTT8_9HELO|nr:hypothetical protein HYALB_00013843 [Hymenoscyphus albidus]
MTLITIITTFIVALLQVTLAQPPYCNGYTAGPGGDWPSPECSVTVRQKPGDWATAELYVYDHNCTEIGFNPGVPFGTEGFELDSTLPYVIIIQNITRGPLTFDYANRHNFPGNNYFLTFDTGISESIPACWNQFVCAPAAFDPPPAHPRAIGEKARKRDTLEASAAYQ